MGYNPVWEVNTDNLGRANLINKWFNWDYGHIWKSKNLDIVFFPEMAGGDLGLTISPRVR